MKNSTIKNLYKLKKILRPKRLKIAEQILIVLFVAVLIPMIISGLVINNINQQAIRKQLNDSAILISNIVSSEIDVFLNVATNEMEQLILSLNHLNTESAKRSYLKQVKSKINYYSDLQIVDTYLEVEQLRVKNNNKENFFIYVETKDNRYLVATFERSELSNHLLKT